MKIVNKPIEIDAVFTFTDAEVDCISRSIFGETKKITEDEVAECIQGIIEKIMMSGVQYVPNKPSDATWLEERTKGMSPSRKASYIRGWKAADERLRKKKTHE